MPPYAFKESNDNPAVCLAALMQCTCGVGQSYGQRGQRRFVCWVRRDAGWLEVRVYSTAKAAVMAAKATAEPVKAAPAPLDVELVRASASDSSEPQPAYIRRVRGPQGPVHK